MANLAKHIPANEGVAKAWANLDGTGTIAERDSHNISGYVDNGTGDYTFTISADMSSANRAVQGTCNEAQSANNSRMVQEIQVPAAGAARLSCTVSSSTATVDCENVYFCVFGDLA